jgi:cyclophilin family peptidyl-prolyl cis-trans isomerase
MPSVFLSSTRQLIQAGIITFTSLSLSAQLMAANTELNVETNKGSFTIELYDEKAPITVKNFLSYVDEGFYEGTIFHRLIPGFMLQGGGFTKELTKKDTKAAIKNEASAELKNLHGTLAMARTSSPNSATSQFFINFADNSHLDFRKYNIGYAVFGQVKPDDLNFIDSLGSAETGTIGIYRDVPKDAIIIQKISRIAMAKDETADTPANADMSASPSEN